MVLAHQFHNQAMPLVTRLDSAQCSQLIPFRSSPVHRRFILSIVNRGPSSNAQQYVELVNLSSQGHQSHRPKTRKINARKSLQASTSSPITQTPFHSSTSLPFPKNTPQHQPCQTYRTYPPAHPQVIPVSSSSLSSETFSN